MRVLSIGNLYPPHFAGGYEILNRGVVEDLRARGHEVRVLVSDRRTGGRGPDDPDVHRTLRSYWEDEEGVVRRGPLRRLALERANAATLRHHLRTLQPELVTWWGMGGLSLSLIEQVRRAGIPAVAVLMDDWPEYAPATDGWLRQFATRPRLGRVAERLTGLPTRIDYAHAATYVFISRSLLERLPPIGPGRVVHPGIDKLFLDPRPAPTEWGGRLLSIGRIDPRKGVGTAIQALAELPEARLTVAGDGPAGFLGELRALAQRAGVAARVDWIGPRGRAELPDLFASHDAVLFPVVWEEPWGLVPLEAMGIGRPVVATGRGGSGEYLRDGENCLLHRPEQPGELARQVRRLAGDDALRERLRAGGLETAGHFTERRFHDELAGLFETVANARTPPR
ncbi:glycosyltransferase family 4 protein [Conexibacter stalactiti]|uniref:Glycosyltransferase family 4 protein n=1 Tax=Conexibacter stalactiti TaxID=1940611 RepID=A0ABU4HSQ6_9ACTN|nr:glycosyltransferase family 4 protein [Conexibacter stalactiti]MDW5596358.1 glycosyltransferase family 4 protein [Conexibacter stalactiti]MEC5037000.1 glycosyltransferase family 4 protein [Conexibacter stalactiti]